MCFEIDIYEYIRWRESINVEDIVNVFHPTAFVREPCMFPKSLHFVGKDEGSSGDADSVFHHGALSDEKNMG